MSLTLVGLRDKHRGRRRDVREFEHVASTALGATSSSVGVASASGPTSLHLDVNDGRVYGVKSWLKDM